jgi:protein-tyrosine phosphatase
MDVLLVCTGNLCRSPIAEHVLRALLAEHGGGDEITFRSAGTRALDGQPMHPHALAVLADRGIDGSDFRTTQLTEQVVAGVDVVLAAALEHRAEAVRLAPATVTRAFTLGELSRICRSIGDREVTEAGTSGRLAEVVRLAAARRTHALPTDPAEDDLADPIGQPFAAFVSCAAELDAILDPLVRLLTDQHIPD